MRMDEHIKRLIEKYTDEASRLAQHEALKKYTMAYEQAKELGNPFTLRACSANLAAIHIKSGKAEDAEKGLRYLEQAVPPEGKTDGASNGDLYFNMGLACQVLRRFRDASSHFEKAWHEYKSERDNLAMEIDSLKRLVQVSSVRQKHKEIVSWNLKLEEAYGRADKPVDRLLAMVQRISLQNRLCQDGVREALDECCAIVDRIRNAGLASENTVSGQLMSEVGMLVQVPVLLTQCKELERARRYLEEAKDVFEAEDGMSMEKAVVLQNLGTICNYLGDWETSIPYHHEAAEIYRYYAGLSPDPRSPLQPKPAKRCQGHCLANHAYALIQLDKVDEARVLFQDALRLAEESDDMDTKWQMEEALGAVHFRLALHDIENPHDMTADIKVALPESRMEHLHKSLTSYKAALKDLANTSSDKPAMQDRVLEKFTQVQAFTQKATAIPYRLTKPNLTATTTIAPVQVEPLTDAGRPSEAASAVTDKDDGETETSDEENEDGETGQEEVGEAEEEEESEEDEDEEGEEESGTTDDDTEEEEEGAGDARDGSSQQLAGRAFPQKPTLTRRSHHVPSTPVRLPNAEDDEDDEQTQLKDLYQQQLESDYGAAMSRDTIPKEAKQAIAILSKLYQETGEKFRQYTGQLTATDDPFARHVGQIERSYRLFKNYPYKVNQACGRRAGELLVGAGVIPILSQVIVGELESGKYLIDNEIGMRHLGLLNNAVAAVGTFTDLSTEVTYAVLDDEKLLPTLLKKLQAWKDTHMEGTLHNYKEHFLRSILVIIHNTAMRDANVPRLRQLEVTQTVAPYLKSDGKTRLSAVATLADVATEEEADRLMTSPDVVKFLFGFLRGALKAKDRRFDGWTVAEDIRAVRQLARNDANKRLLVQEGALPLLMEAAQSDNEEERTESFSALWRLSFCKENHQQFTDNKKLMDLVQKVMHDRKDPFCQAAAEGIMWQLRTELDKSAKLQHLAKEFQKNVAVQGKAKSKGHVMISYNWDHQELVKKIRDGLAKNGIVVWMDLDKMRGSLRESMASAVENAVLVLCCTSQQYKDSSSCRGELEYAADLHKTIIPIRVQNYKPDGWLGYITAGKLYYDFTDRKQFDAKFRELLSAVHEITEGGRQDSPDGSTAEEPIVAEHVKPVTAQHEEATAAASPQSQASPSVDVQKIKAWTPAEVKSFLTNAGLSGPKFQRFTGNLLVRLHKIFTQDEDRFYAHAENNLHLDGYESDALAVAIEKLQTTA